MDHRRKTTEGRRGERGLTLVELLVVLIIIGLVMAFAAPQVLSYLSGARTQAAEVQIKRLDGVLELYFLNTGRYPTTAEGLRALLEAPPGATGWNGPYLKNAEALIDPWGAPYLYVSEGPAGPYDIRSLGADGAEGGDGDAADISLR